MQESLNSTESVAGSVRRTLSDLESYTDQLDQRESSIEKIRSLTEDLEEYERDLEKSRKMLDWLDQNVDCELTYSESMTEWIVFKKGSPIGRGSSVLSALEASYEHETR